MLFIQIYDVKLVLFKILLSKLISSTNATKNGRFFCNNLWSQNWLFSQANSRPFPPTNHGNSAPSINDANNVSISYHSCSLTILYIIISLSPVISRVLFTGMSSVIFYSSIFTAWLGKLLRAPLSDSLHIPNAVRAPLCMVTLHQANNAFVLTSEFWIA